MGWRHPGKSDTAICGNRCVGPGRQQGHIEGRGRLSRESGWGIGVFNSGGTGVDRGPQNWGGFREKGSIDTTINHSLRTLALKAPKKLFEH